jgi:hypothetical protein
MKLVDILQKYSLPGEQSVPVSKLKINDKFLIRKVNMINVAKLR